MLLRNKLSVFGRNYKGLPIIADYRVHETIVEIVRDRCKSKKRCSVLDIATGSGALAQALADEFPAWDIEINDFSGQASVSELKKFKIDLNTDFSDHFDASGYDLILAVEIIEHVENPWHFMREVRKLMRDGGLLLLSTPNVDSTLDRLCYLTDGHPFFFSERGYFNPGGHITMVPDCLFKAITEKVGYQHVERVGAVDTKPHITFGVAGKLFLLLPFFLFMRNQNHRSINVYVCN